MQEYAFHLDASRFPNVRASDHALIAVIVAPCCALPTLGRDSVVDCAFGGRGGSVSRCVASKADCFLFAATKRSSMRKIC